MPPTDEPVLLEQIEEGVATLTINRPQRLNAIDDTLLDAFNEALDRLASGGQVRVLLLKGNRRAFCYGADLEAMREAKLDVEEFRSLLGRFQSVIRKLAHFPAPTIAVLAGFATGAGLDLALACDMRLASEKSKLGEAFIKVGLVPDGGGTLHLPLAVGLARACELALLGDAIDAHEAERIGLVNKVLPLEGLDAAAEELARRIASGPREAIAKTLLMLRRRRDADLEQTLISEAEAQLDLWKSLSLQAFPRLPM